MPKSITTQTETAVTDRLRAISADTLGTPGSRGSAPLFRTSLPPRSTGRAQHKNCPERNGSHAAGDMRATGKIRSLPRLRPYHLNVLLRLGGATRATHLEVVACSAGAGRAVAHVAPDGGVIPDHLAVVEEADPADVALAIPVELLRTRRARSARRAACRSSGSPERWPGARRPRSAAPGSQPSHPA